MRVADGRKMSSPCSDQTQSHFRNQMCQKVGKTPLKKPLPHLETLELFHMLSLCMTELVNWWGEGVGVGCCPSRCEIDWHLVIPFCFLSRMDVCRPAPPPPPPAQPTPLHTLWSVTTLEEIFTNHEVKPQ